ncbi:hypothetical protein BDV96DRAFT_582087 [Lophiotrema nucula]|uniref:Fe2OG dioxygenase domain-containing protein n=1 Tax=Lophiotrema nucula TaxID=690887 RepID=A0A6A5YWR8_9PLEO|nr:hypothetical protein BDV96DRAFT_582087 [Lophiotrema nucula]
MATTAPTKMDSPREHFSVSGLIAKLKARRKRKEEAPKDTRQPLRSSPLPLVLPQHQSTLVNLGWTTVTFPQPAPFPNGLSSPTSPHTSDHATPTPDTHPLQQAYEDLFKASAAFFDLPDSEKQRWKTKLGSEEGWSKIPGEKEFITLRTLEYTPDVLKEPAAKYWKLIGAHLTSSLGRIEGSLGMGTEALSRFVGPCGTLQDTDAGKTATMLRLFRYEGWEEKVVAEPHADLGLLSFVVGDVPGLEVWNGQQFIPIEKTYTQPAGTLLAGRQLQRFSNFRYPAGGHRVVSYGRPSEVDGQEKKYRFSIVFVLRAHEPVIVNSADLETEVTGKWEHPVTDMSAGVLYEQIRNAHFNINTGMKEREEQRRKLEGKKGNEKASG